MKYENYTKDPEKLSTSARRTLRELGTAMSNLMAERRLEDISVKDVCDASLVSKSTFYNYFDDKLDLVWYLMWYFKSEARKGFYRKRTNPESATTEEELLYLIDRTIEIREDIYRLNPVGSLFHNEWTKFLIKSLEGVRESIPNDENRLPDEIAIQAVLYTLSVIVNYCIMNNISHEQRQKYIRIALKSG